MHQIFNKIISIAVGAAMLTICNALAKKIGNGVSELWDSIRADI